MTEAPTAGSDLPAPYHSFAASLAQSLPTERIIVDPLRRLAFGTDASFYRLIPKVVVLVEAETEIRTLLALCHRFGIGVTFRAAGTSLSGQAVGDSVLAVLGDGWDGWRIEADGARIRLQPGVIGAVANRRLAPFGRKIGPDPASIDACKIGGIAANNASGMCCGTAQNSYQTMESIRVILADGGLLDTGDKESRRAFAESHAALLEGLAGLARRTQADEALAARIRRKFKIKNTVGYSLNALIDYSDPFDILAHLLIGSEGTLGFIAQVCYRTVPDHPHRASGLVIFPDLLTAARAVIALKPSPVTAVELLDRASLRAVESRPGMPAYLPTLPAAACALLIETRGGSAADRDANLAQVEAILGQANPLLPPAFTVDRAEIDRQWAVRRGLMPAISALRPAGSTVVTEDVAVSMDNLAEATADLRRVMDKHGYADGIILGHALEGNLHFLFTPDLGIPSEVARYAAFMDDVAEVVVGRYDGSLKAEHGTGRAMAPFVEMEWGQQAFALMQEIKALFDPAGLLNPGVIFTDDPKAHIHHLKPLPAVFAAIDKCVECGFCERFCPSRGLTLTPRQRIVGWRDLSVRRDAGEDTAEAARLYDYLGIDSCAACGLCSLACPVGINTGLLITDLRRRRHGRLAGKTAAFAAGHFALATGLVKAGLTAARVSRRLLGAGTVERLTRSARAAVGAGVPLALESLPNAGQRPVFPAPQGREAVVYVPACPGRTMGPSDLGRDRRPLPQVVAGLLDKAGFDVLLPEGLDRLCCGLTFESKGLFEAAEAKGEEMAAAILAASRGGQLPVVMDASPCSLRMKGVLRARAALFDLPEFLHDRVLPRLRLEKGLQPVFLHVPCSVKRMGHEDKLRALAEACCARVSVADEVTCCGFAGDKGLFRPELNAHALRSLKETVPAGSIGCSSSRTCEIGLEHHAGRSVQSIAYLLDACVRDR